MHIKDHNDAMKFFRTYDNVASKGKWKEFVDEMEFDSMAQEPRTMAQGGRIGFGDGSITQVRNKSKNVVGENLRLFNQDKLYHLRLGLDKKNYYGTKEKLENIFKKRETPGGARVRNIQPPKGLVTGKDMLETAKKKNIYVGKNRQASNFADVFNFPKTTKDGQMFYDINKLNNEKTLDKILEAQVRSGSATNYAKKRFPVKSTYAHTKKRYLAEKAAGGVKDSGWAAKRGSGVQLGHAEDFWTGRKITPQNLLYTPSEINKLMGDPGMLDDKINAVYEKQEYGKLTKKGDDLKKFLNETDATLTRLASQSGGFKQVTLSNGGVFGGQRLSVDMFDEFKGMSQKETVNFVNKWKDKKTWNTAEEFNNIKKAKLFEINRKEQLKAASKIGKKEQSKVLTELERQFIKLCKRKGSASGGRIGLAAGTPTVTCGMNQLTKYLTKTGVPDAERTLVSRILGMGKGLIKGAGQILNPLELFKLKNWVSPQALAAFALFDTAFVADDVLRKGKPLNEAVAGNWLTNIGGFLDEEAEKAKNILGSNKYQLSPAAKEYAQSLVDINEYNNLDNYEKVYGLAGATHTITPEIREKVESDKNTLYDKIMKTPTTGQLDYESVVTERQDVFTATPKKSKILDFFGIDYEKDAPNKPGLPSFTSGQTKKQIVPGEYIQKKGQLPEPKITDVPAYVSENYKTSYTPTNEVINKYLQSIGERSLKSGEGTLIRMQQPGAGLYGTQDKFAGGGIASLMKKK